MVTIYHKSLKKPKWEKLEKFSPNSWVYVVDPNEKELQKLVDEFKLERGHLDDALDPYEAPRLEIEGQTVYVFNRFPVKVADRIVTMPVLFISGKEFVITVSKIQLPFFDYLMSDAAQVYTTQRTKLFLQILQQTNAAYQHQLTAINKEIHRLSGHIESITNKEIAQFVLLEGVLNDFTISLVPQNNIFSKLLSAKIFTLYEPDKDLIEDLLLSNSQLIESGRTNLRTIVGIREAHSTIATSNLNRVIKLLTSLAVLLTVPMIITSLYGMNISLPLADSPLAFVGIIVAILAISALLLWLFIRNRWL